MAEATRRRSILSEPLAVPQWASLEPLFRWRRQAQTSPLLPLYFQDRPPLAKTFFALVLAVAVCVPLVAAGLAVTFPAFYGFHFAFDVTATVGLLALAIGGWIARKRAWMRFLDKTLRADPSLLARAGTAELIGPSVLQSIHDYAILLCALIAATLAWSPVAFFAERLATPDRIAALGAAKTVLIVFWWLAVGLASLFLMMIVHPSICLLESLHWRAVARRQSAARAFALPLVALLGYILVCGLVWALLVPALDLAQDRPPVVALALLAMIVLMEMAAWWLGLRMAQAVFARTEECLTLDRWMAPSEDVPRDVPAAPIVSPRMGE